MSLNQSYLEDASGFQGFADQVIVAADEEEVCQTLKAASGQRIPVTVAGAGTGLTGGRVPQGGWVLSLEKFTRLEVRRGNATAGAGVLLRDLQAAAKPTGQFYGPDPTEWGASVGGSIATNASGSRSFLYGATRRHVLSLNVAFMDGSVRTFRRGDPIGFDVPAVSLPSARKHSAGYPLAPGMDWVDLLVGSEGTLGVITEAELTLLPSPPDLLTGVVFFPDDAQALAAVNAWRPVDGLRMLEYLDRASLDLLRPRFPDTPKGATALLFEQILEEAPDAEYERWEERLAQSDALVEKSWFAASDVDRERFRRFRHALPEAVNDIVRANGYMKVGSDYAVPIDMNRAMLAFYRERLDARFPHNSVVFGHIGDAHVHVNILPASDEDFTAAQTLMLEFARRAVGLGGSVAAEHGLGKRKTHLLPLQYPEFEIEAMKAVKTRLDPCWLLGRGNLFGPALPELCSWNSAIFG